MTRLLNFLWQRFHAANVSRRTEIVALFLAVAFATHPFWCVISSFGIDQPQSAPRVTAFAPAPAAQVARGLSAQQPRMDACCGNADEHVFLNSARPIALPELLFVFLPLLWLALLIVFSPLLPHGAMVFGRDGPLCIRQLHSRLVRASLPHRAPPALLF